MNYTFKNNIVPSKEYYNGIILIPFKNSYLSCGNVLDITSDELLAEVDKMYEHIIHRYQISHHDKLLLDNGIEVPVIYLSNKQDYNRVFNTHDLATLNEVLSSHSSIVIERYLDKDDACYITIHDPFSNNIEVSPNTKLIRFIELYFDSIGQQVRWNNSGNIFRISLKYSDVKILEIPSIIKIGEGRLSGASIYFNGNGLTNKLVGRCINNCENYITCEIHKDCQDLLPDCQVHSVSISGDESIKCVTLICKEGK